MASNILKTARTHFYAKTKSLLNRLEFAAFASTKSPEIPTNVLSDIYKGHEQSQNGKVYDKRPFRLQLEAGKKYMWCLCGHSHSQPFCDGTHKNQQLRITQKPVAFGVKETKEYWLCNCKQTKNRPFCDGTHKAPEIQDGPTVAR